MLSRLLVLFSAAALLLCSHWSPLALASASEVAAAASTESASSATVAADPPRTGVLNLPALRYPTLGPLYTSSNPPCVWYASRVCTNVVWSTPNTAELQSPVLEKELKQRIVTNRKFTGSRICQRWYADYECRRVFPFCHPVSGNLGGPCLRECEALRRRCPSMQVDCKGMTDLQGQCLRREEITTDALTPGMMITDTNEVD